MKTVKQVKEALALDTMLKVVQQARLEREAKQHKVIRKRNKWVDLFPVMKGI